MKKIKIEVYKGIILFPYPARRSPFNPNRIIPLDTEYAKRKIDYEIESNNKNMKKYLKLNKKKIS